MIQVYGYARKSPDDKGKIESSIDNQIKLIKDTCRKKNWRLGRIFIDKNISGGDRFRKGFIDMINSAIEFKIKILIVKEQDRFARDSAFFSDTLRDLEIRNIKVFSVLKNNFLSTEDLGDMVNSLVDAHYITTQRKKSNVLMEQKMNDGLPPIKAPFGYKFSKIKKNKIWLIQPKNAEIVREINKDAQNCINYKDTINRLKIDKSLYYRVLNGIRKGVYNGFVVYERKYRDSNKKLIRTELIKYKGKHEAIL